MICKNKYYFFIFLLFLNISIIFFPNIFEIFTTCFSFIKNASRRVTRLFAIGVRNRWPKGDTTPPINAMVDHRRPGNGGRPSRCLFRPDLCFRYTGNELCPLNARLSSRVALVLKQIAPLSKVRIVTIITKLFSNKIIILCEYIKSINRLLSFYIIINIVFYKKIISLILLISIKFNFIPIKP